MLVVVDYGRVGYVVGMVMGIRFVLCCCVVMMMIFVVVILLVVISYLGSDYGFGW